MKRILLILMFAFMQMGASTEEVDVIYISFIAKNMEYYKLWAVGYCLGHFQIQENHTDGDEMASSDPSSHFETESKIGNIVYMGGIEPLKEIKAYIDKKRSYYDIDRVNYCLRILDPVRRDIGMENEVKRIVKKYCESCK